jgi:hypothetical protein
VDLSKLPSENELQILDVITKIGAGSVREIQAFIYANHYQKPKGKPWNNHLIQTYCSKLLYRKLIVYHKDGDFYRVANVPIAQEILAQWANFKDTLKLESQSFNQGSPDPATARPAITRIISFAWRKDALVA